jgi:hypothetical protein
VEGAAGGDEGKFTARRLIGFRQLDAASTDSVPLLQKKLYFSLPGVKAARVFASIARSGSSSS